MLEAACALGRAVNYESAGTVEFICDVARQDFYFLKVNTRLQVEHPVTEALYGVDLVEWMIRQAAGEDVLSGAENLTPRGAAMEARLYAENPGAGFRPSAGLLTEVVFPEGVRVDGGIETGAEVTANYDPMLAKIIVHGDTRDDALAKLRAALAQTRIFGVETNLAYLSAIAGSPAFQRGEVATNLLGQFPFQPRSLGVLSLGAQSTLQEPPGRVGLWDVGVPPTGPMDALSFRLANALVGNCETATALEMTARGPTLRFNADAVFALAGARMKATLEGVEIPNHAPLAAKASQALALGAVEGPGLRAYLALRGAFDAPVYLGSRATFTLGGFGGHGVGALKAGDGLRFADTPAPDEPRPAQPQEIPALTHDWRLSVLYGPHGTPDFFLDEDIETLFGAAYEVHFNSARTGVRLSGPPAEMGARGRGRGGPASLQHS